MDNRIAFYSKTDENETGNNLFEYKFSAKKSQEIDGLLIRQINSKGIRAMCYENRSADHKTYILPAEDDSVLLHFQFSGSCMIRSSSGEMSFKANEQNLCRSPARHCHLNIGSHTEFCIIKLGYKNIERLDIGLDAFGSKGFALLNKHHLPITLPMSDCIESMFNSDRTGIFGMLHTESLIIQLLLLQLEQTANHDCRVFCSLKQSEIDKIYRARKIITQNLNSWFSIAEIAYKIGTNECTLKKGFKEVFGTPVFEFTQQYKMREAYRLLSESDHSIAYVAEKLGYKNATHFSAAFKRKFGFPPGKARLPGK